MGRLPLRPGSRARSVRLRRGASDRRARREAAAADREPAGAPLRAGDGPGVGRARHALAERRPRARPHRRRRAGRDPRPARHARRDAARQGRRTSSRSCGVRPTISAGAHVRAMRATRPGVMEYEIEAELLYEFRRHGSQFPAYWPIVAGGAERVHPALPRERQAARGRDAAPDRRRLRARRLRRRHHPHLPGGRALQRPAARDLRARARRPARGDRGSEARQPLERAARRRGEGARAGLHRPRPLPGHARRGAREGRLQALLHASHRALARARRARRRATTRRAASGSRSGRA